MPSAASWVAKPSRLTRWASMKRTRPIGRLWSDSVSAIERTSRLGPQPRAGRGERVVLLPAGSADPDCSRHQPVVPQGYAATERDEPTARRRVVAGEVAPGRDLVAQVQRGDPVAGGCVGLVDRDRRPRELRAVHPPEGDQVSAGVDDGRGHQAVLGGCGVARRSGHPLRQLQTDPHAGPPMALAWSRSRAWIPPYAVTPGR